MATKLITPSADYPFTVAQAKEHLRVQDDDENDLIEAILAAAVDSAERFTGRAFIDQTWDYYADAFPTDGKSIYLPNPPLIEVVGLFYRDSAGSEQEFSAAGYVVDSASEKARVSLAFSGSWPTVQVGLNALRVRYRAGYLNADSPPTANVPASIIAAIKLTVGHLYANRESVVVGTTAVQLPYAAEWLLRQHRVHVAIG